MSDFDALERATAAVDQLAAKLAAADGLDWDEQCGLELTDGDDCDSGTCVAVHYEDHDPEVARANYRRYARIALARVGPPEVAHLQQRVAPWLDATFGSTISNDRVERGDRLLEEVLELLQAGGYDPTRVAALTGYVWRRPSGDTEQEVGGVMVTLAAYCLAFGVDMHTAGDVELARVWTKVAAIRAKQAAKPTGSALPIAIEEDLDAPASRLAMVRVALQGIVDGLDALPLARAGIDLCDLTEAERAAMRGDG